MVWAAGSSDRISPIVLIAAGLLSFPLIGAFRKMTTDFMELDSRPGNIFNVVIRVTFCTYFLCTDFFICVREASWRKREGSQKW